MEAIRDLGDKYNFRIIEDGCHALGGHYKEHPIGGCTYSDITVFSLHPVKTITAGEGGLILTNSTELFEKMSLLRNHGLVKDEGVTDPWHVEAQSEGFNYKITEMQCALGLSQLQKMDSFVSKRRLLAECYQSNLKDLPIRFQATNDDSESAWHLMIMCFDFAALGLSKKDFYAEMKQKGIVLSVHYYPIHLHALYRQLGFRPRLLPKAERYYEEAFSFPLHPNLTLEDVDYICDGIRRAIG
jgi:dTDP-4-amino-4,6-dideoxygalactose transaminase